MTANEYLNKDLTSPAGSVFDMCNSWPLGQVMVMLKFAEYYHERREQEARDQQALSAAMWDGQQDTAK